MNKRFYLLGVPLILAIGMFAGCATGEDNACFPAPMPNEETCESVHAPVGKPEKVTVSRYAALDKVDFESAFGDDGSEAWRYGLTVAADMSTTVSARWYSEIADCERFYVMAGVSLAAQDTLGLARGEAQNLNLFGGGSLAVALKGAAPSSQSPVKETTAKLGIYHDGDWVVLTDGDGKEKRIGTREFCDYLASVCADETLGHIIETAEIIPESIAQGSLRVGVEKLASLGFEVVIDETDGLRVTLNADAGVFTDWLNDTLEEVLPEEILKYIPRADVRYSSSLFSLTIAFDEAGAFEEYTLSSDVSLDTSLRVRGLFALRCSYTVAGGFSVTGCNGIPENI